MHGQQFPGLGAEGLLTASTPFFPYKLYYDQLTALVAALSTQVSSAKEDGDPGTPHTAECLTDKDSGNNAPTQSFEH